MVLIAFEGALFCFVYKVLFCLSINIVEKSILEEELKAFCLFSFWNIVCFLIKKVNCLNFFLLKVQMFKSYYNFG